MPYLADVIERYIQAMLHDQNQDVILLQRNELANELGCAPSQVSYVLSTRFTIDRGYLVESRKGSGGYIRVRKVRIFQEANRPVEVPDDHFVSVEEMDHILTALQGQGVLTRREEILLRIVWQEMKRRTAEPDATELIQSVVLRLLQR